MFREVVLTQLLKIQRWSREHEQKLLWRDIRMRDLDAERWNKNRKMQDMCTTIEEMKIMSDKKEAMRESLASFFRLKTEAEQASREHHEKEGKQIK